MKMSKKEIVEKKVLKSIKCDICNKEYSYTDKNIDSMYEAQEFFSLRQVGGYGSIFGDGSKISIDICQHCMRKKLGEHLIIKC